MINVMDQTREMTKRQVNFTAVLLFSFFPLTHFLVSCFTLSEDILFFEQINMMFDLTLSILLYFSLFSYLLWILTAVRWIVRYKAYKGLEQAYKRWIAILKIRKMFLDSNYFVNRIYFGRKISEPLKVKLDFLNNGQALLYVENHMKFDLRLDGARISSALGNYIVESDYISKDNNYYIYELINAKTMDLQNEFETYIDYQKWCMTDVNNYQLKIDDRLTLEYGHFLIVGRTGSGKTYGLYHLILQAYMKADDKQPMIFFCDPKGSSLMVVGKKVSSDTTALPAPGEVSNFSAIKDEIEKVYKLLLDRQKELEPKLDKEKLDADYSDFGMKPIILIIDEWGALSKLLSAETRKEEPRKIIDMVTSIIFMGRQLGVFVWIIMQQANAKALTTEIRDSMMFRTVLGNSERTTYETAFDVSEVADVPKTKKNAGIGVYRYDKSPKNKVSLLAFPYLNFDILKEFERIGKDK